MWCTQQLSLLALPAFPHVLLQNSLASGTLKPVLFRREYYTKLEPDQRILEQQKWKKKIRIETN